MYKLFLFIVLPLLLLPESTLLSALLKKSASSNVLPRPGQKRKGIKKGEQALLAELIEKLQNGKDGELANVLRKEEIKLIHIQNVIKQTIKDGLPVTANKMRILFARYSHLKKDNQRNILHTILGGKNHEYYVLKALRVHPKLISEYLFRVDDANRSPVSELLESLKRRLSRLSRFPTQATMKDMLSLRDGISIILTIEGDDAFEKIRKMIVRIFINSDLLMLLKNKIRELSIVDYMNFEDELERYIIEREILAKYNFHVNRSFLRVLKQVLNRSNNHKGDRVILKVQSYLRRKLSSDLRLNLARVLYFHKKKRLDELKRRIKRLEESKEMSDIEASDKEEECPAIECLGASTIVTASS